jgi:hypothetical protein
MAMLSAGSAWAQDPAWEWHAVEGAKCRDGSEAGYYLRRSALDQRLVIFLEGGGACFNGLTCGQNPANVGNQFPTKEGIFADRDDNPLRGSNFMYVPYCTGDIFGGTRENVAVSGVGGRQNFVGFRNMNLFLEKIQTDLPDLDLVVLSGVSAGGFGAIFNYPHVRERFPEIPVVLIDDSGVPLEDNYLQPCLQRTFRNLWGLNDAIPQDCPSCRAENGGGLVELIRYTQDKYGDQQQGVILSTQDSVLRFFFGFSLNNCRVLFPNMPANTYEAGIRSLKANYLQGSIKSFIVPGTTHTFISSNRFYETKSDGQSIAQWVQDLVDQKAKDKGPRRLRSLADQ